MKIAIVAGCLLSIGAAASADVVQFLASDGNRLYRGDLAGNVQPYVTLPAGVQSLTRVPEGYSVSGAQAGDIIATASDATGNLWKVYRLDDPFGTPSLVEIGATTFGVGSIAFSPTGIYAANDTVSPIRVSRLDATNFANLQNYSTGVSVTGLGGLAYNPGADLFYFTDYTNHRLMRWTPGSTAAVVGPTGIGFSNNGMEFLNGTLYGALRLDSPSTQMRVGTFDQSTGAFTGTTTITGILGNGTGFVTIPAPAPLSLALLGLGASRRRRR